MQKFMTISQRITSLVSLGKQLNDLTSSEISGVFETAEADNPWFTKDNIKKSVIAIRDHYLTQEALDFLVAGIKLMIILCQKKLVLSLPVIFRWLDSMISFVVF